jgi:hypothetical protein
MGVPRGRQPVRLGFEMLEDGIRDHNQGTQLSHPRAELDIFAEAVAGQRLIKPERLED